MEKREKVIKTKRELVFTITEFEDGTCDYDIGGSMSRIEAIGVGNLITNHFVNSYEFKKTTEK